MLRCICVTHKCRTIKRQMFLVMLPFTCFSKMREISPRILSRLDTLLVTHWPLSWLCSCFNRRCNLNIHKTFVTIHQLTEYFLKKKVELGMFLYNKWLSNKLGDQAKGYSTENPQLFLNRGKNNKMYNSKLKVEKRTWPCMESQGTVFSPPSTSHIPSPCRWRNRKMSQNPRKKTSLASQLRTHPRTVWRGKKTFKPSLFIWPVSHSPKKWHQIITRLVLGDKCFCCHTLNLPRGHLH